ncbi:MAG: hypothetical protein ACTS4W_00375 [Candidatus Hodgkinia cicadicola]
MRTSFEGLIRWAEFNEVKVTFSNEVSLPSLSLESQCLRQYLLTFVSFFTKTKFYRRTLRLNRSY